jgi:CHAD domain-containing protein
VRDLEVMRDILAACAASLPAADVSHLEPLFAAAAAERDTARDAMLAALDSERNEMLQRLLAHAAATPPLAHDTDLDAVAIARRTTRSAWKRLERDVHALGPAPSDAALHDVRLRAKRARFAAEAAIPLVGNPARKFAKSMANLQGVLGAQHDAVVAHHWVRERAMHEEPTVAFAAGMVAGLLRNASQSAAREFPLVWTKASRLKLRSWL